MSLTKRLLDLSVAAAGLTLLSPLLVATAFWIKIDSPGPVFYRGRRGGLGGKPFEMLKFRSMVVNADQVGGPTTSGDDPRMTQSGKFVRRWKIDELPQLLNVLWGEMSLVGPRPEVVYKTEQYTSDESRVLDLRPGITDWASIWNADEGGVLAGATDSDAAYEAVIRPFKMKLQLSYADNHSSLVDLRILACTALRIAGKQISPPELMGYPTFDELREAVLARETLAAA